MSRYHGKDACDPEGGVCKRRLDAMQMQMQKAFDSCLAAFDAMKNDKAWTRTESTRPCTLSPLGLFIESRTAVWVPRDVLEAQRKAVPRLAVLKGIHSVYGLRWSPAVQTFTPQLFFACARPVFNPFLVANPACTQALQLRLPTAFDTFVLAVPKPSPFPP